MQKSFIESGLFAQYPNYFPDKRHALSWTKQKRNRVSLINSILHIIIDNINMKITCSQSLNILRGWTMPTLVHYLLPWNLFSRMRLCHIIWCQIVLLSWLILNHWNVFAFNRVDSHSVMTVKQITIWFRLPWIDKINSIIYFLTAWSSRLTCIDRVLLTRRHSTIWIHKRLKIQYFVLINLKCTFNLTAFFPIQRIIRQ